MTDRWDVETALSAIETRNGAVNAFTAVTDARARREATGAGPLAGVPFAVKNLFDIAGLPTRAGSKILKDAPPAEADALLVARMNRAGAALTGALNMGEFAYDFTGENAHDGACRNPHDPERMTGGSSSGSGAAVAARMVPVALGSDTNGSIRVPASLCGVYGLKPTYGRLPRLGSYPFCDSLDHLGPLALSPELLALSYDAMQGPAPGDHHLADRPVEPTAASLSDGVGDLRIAIAGGFFDTAGLPEAAAAVERAAKALGARAVLPMTGAAEARAAAFIITNCESARLHLPQLRTRPQDFDPDTVDRFLAGAVLPASWLVRAQQVRRWFAVEMARVFREVDLIIAPATPFTAPKIGQKTMTLRGEEALVRPNLGLFTQPISCIGLPAVVAPVFEAGAAPIGVQLIAAPWNEAFCLRAAEALRVAGVSVAHPPPAP